MKIKKKHLYIGIAALILIFGALFYYKSYYPATEDAKQNEEKILWMVDTTGHIFYPLERGAIEFNRENYEETENLIVSKVIFKSTRGNVYGLLVLPKKTNEQLPGVVLLPGAGVSKESELPLAKKIAELGAAVLTIDHRGTGETGGKFPSLEEDLVIFSQGQEPYQHLMIYDALRAYDLLYSAPFIDPERIIIVGESLGGRVGIIATAIDTNIKGLIVISAPSLKFAPTNDTLKDAFFASIDADNYLDMISPRRLVFIHNKYDVAIPVGNAVQSYMKALEPKGFILINDTSCGHGYCNSMWQGLTEALDYVAGIRNQDSNATNETESS